ncbi:MAG: PKD domain-containing protein [Euryarchaeota archaeon]|nr:PKD domain-containing protein [Euryarchaeota archaeon]
MIKKRDYLLICMLAIALTAPAATSLHNDVVAPIMPDDTTQPTIDGPHAGKVNTNYTFTIGPITDPEGDQFYFFLDWGDGTTSGWQSLYSSGQTSTATHSWSQPGTYNIRLKVKDATGAESNWSEPFTIYITSKIILIGFVQSGGNPSPEYALCNMSIALVIKLRPMDLKIYSSVQVVFLNDEFHGMMGSRFFAVVIWGLVLSEEE